MTPDNGLKPIPSRKSGICWYCTEKIPHPTNMHFCTVDDVPALIHVKCAKQICQAYGIINKYRSKSK